MSESDSNCCCHRNSNFVVGLIFGAVIGAVIAIIIYKNDKTKVFDSLYKKLSGFLKNFKAPAQTSRPSQSSKKLIASKTIKKPVRKKSPKTFIRPKG
ncbi:MAG: hypothetical protein WC596_01660 [Candidatus Shapirobacteria bacterium]